MIFSGIWKICYEADAEDYPEYEDRSDRARQILHSISIHAAILIIGARQDGKDLHIGLQHLYQTSMFQVTAIISALSRTSPH